MNWEIDWGVGSPKPGGPVFGYDFGEILAEGIEAGIEEIDYVRLHGSYCEACGAWRICWLYEVECVTPTDRGELRELMPYTLCKECIKDFDNNQAE